MHIISSREYNWKIIIKIMMKIKSDIDFGTIFYGYLGLYFKIIRKIFYAFIE